MKKTSRQSTTSTIGVMLMCGKSSDWWRSQSIGHGPPREQGRRKRTKGIRPRDRVLEVERPVWLAVDPGLVADDVVVRRWDCRGSSVARRRQDRLARDEVDDPPG